MKKGFTLIEIVSVVVILSILLLLIIPSVSNILDKNRKNIYIETEERLIKAAERYIITTGIFISNNSSLLITHEDLLEYELIEELKDIENKQEPCEALILIKKINNEIEITPHLICSQYTSSTTIEL